MGGVGWAGQRSLSTSAFKAAYRAAKPPESDVDFLCQLQASHTLTHTHEHTHTHTHTHKHTHIRTRTHTKHSRT